MYLYYTGMTVPVVRRRIKAIGVYITMLQIAQMVVGIGASASTLAADWHGRPCHASRTNGILALAMYASYAYLFLRFYTKAYQTPRPTKTV